MNIQQLFSNSFKSKDGSYSNTFTSKELEIIQENKLFKCFLPKNLGGLEMNLFRTLDVIEQCAYINGSLGWMIQIGNGGNYFVTNIQNLIHYRFGKCYCCCIGKIINRAFNIYTFHSFQSIGYAIGFELYFPNDI